VEVSTEAECQGSEVVRFSANITWYGVYAASLTVDDHDRQQYLNHNDAPLGYMDCVGSVYFAVGRSLFCG